MRAQCSVFIATSLDGFIAGADGRIDWLSIVESPGEDYGYKRFLDSIDTLVIGRKTYEKALGFANWQYAGKRCVVLTRERGGPSKHGEEFSSEAPGALVRGLSSEGSKRICVDGGAVIQSFLAAGLVTDMTISIIPVLLGEGIPLFGRTGADVRLDMVASRAFESGLVQVEYRVGKSARPGTAKRKRPKVRAEREAGRVERQSRPKDVIGFLLALPMAPTSVEVSRLAHEFGITGPVDVKSYTAPDDNIHFDLIEGDPGYSVTLYPKDMKGCIGRLADKLLERFGGAAMAGDGDTSDPRAEKATASRRERR